MTRYERYKRLCEQRGIAPQWDRWQSHWAELQRPVEEQFIRLTRDQHFAFWRERFNPEEIFAMAAGIYSTTREETSL